GRARPQAEYPASPEPSWRDSLHADQDQALERAGRGERWPARADLPLSSTGPAEEGRELAALAQGTRTKQGVARRLLRQEREERTHLGRVSPPLPRGDEGGTAAGVDRRAGRPRRRGQDDHAALFVGL